MKKIVTENPVTFYEAKDGRKFQKPEDCERYEYLLFKWQDEVFITQNIDETELRCYYVTCYEDLKELQNYERIKEWNYPSILSESFYQFPCWVYVPYSPSGLDYPEAIEGISILEKTIEETETLLNKIHNDIAQMKGKR